MARGSTFLWGELDERLEPPPLRLRPTARVSDRVGDAEVDQSGQRAERGLGQRLRGRKVAAAERVQPHHPIAGGTPERPSEAHPCRAGREPGAREGMKTFGSLR